MAELAVAAMDVHTERLQPTYLLVTGPTQPELRVGLIGSAGAVEWQSSEITTRLAAFGLKRSEPAVNPGDRDESARVVARQATVSARIAVRPADTPALIRTLRPLAGKIDCQVGVGLIDIHFRADVLPETGSVRMWVERVRRSLPAGAHCVWTRVPDDWTDDIDVWGPTRPDIHLMRSVKAAFDPINLFSPGRFVGKL